MATGEVETYFIIRNLDFISFCISFRVELFYLGRIDCHAVSSNVSAEQIRIRPGGLDQARHMAFLAGNT